MTPSGGWGRLLRLGTGATAFGAVAVMYLILHRDDPAPDRLRNTVNYFSYFTILSNLLVGVACVAPVARPGSRTARFFLTPSVRAAIALYISITAIVFAVLLAPLYHPEGAQKAVDHVLHRVVPLLYLADWGFLVPRGALAPRHAVAWLAFPLIYGGYTLVHGAWSGWYPYPFMAVDQLGYPQALMNVGGMSVGFVVLGLLLIGLDRTLARRTGEPSAR